MPVPSGRRRNRIESDDEEEEERIAAPAVPTDLDDEDLSRPQPLGKAQAPNIRQLINDFRQQSELIASAIRLLIETAEQTAEAHSQNPDYEPLRQLDVDLRELIDLQAEKAARQKALTEMMQELDAGHALDDPIERYNTAVRDQMDAYRKLTSRKKYAQNEFYHNFRDALWTATEEGAMPPVRDLIPPEQGDEDDLDDDIVAGGATQNFRCPITTNLFEDPITNTNCKHSYSKAAIYEFVLHNNRCPAQGCNKPVSRSSLKPDPALARKVATFQRREEERQFARRQQNTILD